MVGGSPAHRVRPSRWERRGHRLVTFQHSRCWNCRHVVSPCVMVDLVAEQRRRRSLSGSLYKWQMELEKGKEDVNQQAGAEWQSYCTPAPPRRREPRMG